MADTIVIRRGLTIPIAGAPVQDIKPGPQISRVGLVADDYLGMRPSMLVQAGDRVKLEMSPYDLTKGRINYRHK